MLAESGESCASTPAPDAVLVMLNSDDMQGAVCAALTPAIKETLRNLSSGQILEVQVDDPTAEGDITAWCRLSGNELLARIHEGSMLRCYVRKK